MAQLKKGQSYPELGFKIDSKGVAIDLVTGKGIPKAVVDAKLAGTDLTQLDKKRGGIAGVYDRNKAAIPIAQTALAMLPGIGPLASAAMGAVRGFDRPGQGGIGYDVGTGLKGAATGYAAGMTGNALQGALGAGQTAAQGASGGFLDKLGKGVKAAVPALLGGGVPGVPSLPGVSVPGLPGSVGGDSTPAWMKALAAAQVANAAALGKKSGDYADTAWKTSKDFWDQRQPLRDKGIAGMQAAPVQLPQLAKIAAGGNPFAQG